MEVLIRQVSLDPEESWPKIKPEKLTSYHHGKNRHRLYVWQKAPGTKRPEIKKLLEMYAGAATGDTGCSFYSSQGSCEGNRYCRPDSPEQQMQD